jgi:SAM-dependent methyltransferase
VKPAEYHRMREAEEAQWWYVGQRAIAHALLESTGAGAGERPPGRLLDAGCGTGGNLLHLARLDKVARTAGIDLAPEALAACREKGLTVARGSLLALPFAEESFELVTSFDVIYHAWVPDDDAAIDELRRVLRPGGLLLVRVPALELLRGAHDEAVDTRHRYTRSELVRLFEDHGLEVVRSTYANTFLFPLLLVRRTLDRILGRAGSDVGFLPAPFEWLFRRILFAEAALVSRGLALPVGASVLVLGRKAL